MADDKFSCIKEVTKTVRIILPAACISNEISGISDVLEGWKRQYKRELKAVVVSYKNISLVSSGGFIKADYPVLAYNVKATFELFYPTVGSIVKGKVNRISHDYIGCLVHNTINVTIDRSNGFSSFISLDTFILFEITRLDFKRKIIHVRGKISQKCVQLMTESGMINTEIHNHVNNYENTSDFSQGVDSDALSNNFMTEEMSTDSGHYSPKKKKSKKSKSISPSSNNNEQNSSLELENPGTSSQKKKKKSEQELLSSPSFFNESVNEIEPTQLSENQLAYLKSEIHTDSSTSISPLKAAHKKKKQKKSKQDLLSVPPFLNESVNEIEPTQLSQNLSSNLKNEIDTDSSSISPSKSARKRTSKTPTSSPKKKHNKTTSATSSSNFGNVDSLFDIKEEVHSQEIPINNSSSPKKKKSKKSKSAASSSDLGNVDSLFDIKEEVLSQEIPANQSSSVPDDFRDVYEMMKSLSAFEPSLESQLGNDVSQSILKKEPFEENKTAKKRKRESSDANSLPKKKRKIKEGVSVSSESKDKPHKKKKKKDKSKKDSKKDKKKKSKDKVISTKKKLPGKKNKLKKKKKPEKSKTEKVKKPKKSKIKKEKKSVKQKTKKVPLDVTIKSETS